jgi:hypothetical protein
LVKGTANLPINIGEAETKTLKTWQKPKIGLHRNAGP